MSSVAGLAAAVALPLGSQAQTNCDPAPSGLVSWWRAEGNANDSASTNNGVLQGNLGFALGEVGQAFSFNGSNAYILVAASSNLNVGAGGGFTIEGWLKPDDVSTGGGHAVAEWNNGAGGVGLHLWHSIPIYGGLGSIFANLRDTLGNDHFIATSAGVLTTNFQHIALTYDNASGLGRLYLNGSVAASTTLGTFTLQTSYAFYLGKRPGESGTLYQGLLDEVSIYSRALASNEIAAVYLAGSAGKCSQTPPTNCVPAPSGMVSWWRGESNALDSVGTNNGTLQGGTTFAPGEVGQAFNFNGTSAYVQVADSPNLRFTTAMTIEAWVYVRTSGGSFREIASKWEGGSNQRSYVFDIYPDGRAEFAVNSDGVSSIISAFSANPIPTNQWSHLAGVYDGTSVKLYLNGALQSSNSWTNGIFPGTAPLIIGSTLVSGSYFDGQVDELGLYSRALAATEIQAIYNAGSLGKCPPTPPTNCVPSPSGLLSWWRAEGDGTDSINANTAVLLNGTSFTNGEVGQGFSFDGISDEIIVSNSPTINIGTNDFSIEGWIKAFPNSTAYSLNTIIDKRFNQTIGYEFTLESGSLHLRLSSTPGSDGTGGTEGPDLRDGNFHHVAVSVTRSSSSGIVFYVDGAAVGTADPTSQQGSLSNSAVMVIGEHSAGLNTYFDGVIDELSLYGRALSAAEIQGIYNAGTAGKCAPAPPTNCVPPVAGLVSWWRGEGNALDQADGNNGTLVGNTTFGPGRVGQAFVLDGSGDAISLGNPTNLQLQNFTIEAWIKRASPSVASYGVDHSAGILDGTTGGYAFGLWDDGRLLLSKVYVDSTSSSFAITDTNTFHHVAVTKNGTAVVFYLDGVSQAVPPYNSTFEFSGSAFAIGARGGDYGSSFLGSIDEVSVYNRALSSSEVQSIYAAGAAGKCVTPPPNCVTPPSGIVSWWRGESNALDSVGSNNGTLQGGATFATGEVGQAFNLNGTSAFVQVADAPSLRFTTAMTFEAWVYPRALGGAYQEIMSKWDGGVNQRSYLSAVDPDGRVEFTVNSDGGNNLAVAFSLNPIAANQWTHVAGVYDGASVRLYLNGVLQNSTPWTQGIFPGSVPLSIGSALVSGSFFGGLIDEPSLYNRALTAAEIQAIYNAGSAGKCATPTAPFIVTQPASQTVTAGAGATFSVGAGGSPTLTYQWQFNSNNIAGATGSSYTIASAQSSNAGLYSVAITNSVGFAISSNATLTVNPGPSALRVGDAGVASGGTVTIPVLLTANGNENALSFSLNFDTNRLTYVRTFLASGSGATLLTNESQTAMGHLGVVLGMPTGATFPPGAQELIEVTFTAAIVPTATSTPVNFGDQPLTRQVSDTNSHVLPATYTGGNVAIAAVAYEADVSPRPTGDQDVTVTDWVLVGRFVARLDFPTNAGEFQRADCAPRATLGDGRLTIIDWVQAGRYAARLDPLTPVGGPNAPSPAASVQVKSAGPTPLVTRQVSVDSTTLNQGMSGTVSISLQAQGDENALGFTLSFDPAKLSYNGATLGSGASGATLNVNTSEAGAGRVGFALALGSGAHFAAGADELAKVTFQASVSTNGNASIGFADDPIYREISDPSANVLTADYLGTAITVNPVPLLTISQSVQSVTLAWPSWATNYALQQSDGSVNSPAGWTNSSATVTTTGNQSSVTVPMEVSTRFYRLLKQ
jgi:hypothetical protein